MNEEEKLTSVQMKKFLELTGKRGGQVISVLAKLFPTYDAYNTSIGKEILKEDIDRLEELLPIVYQEKATPEQLIEFRYLRDTRLPRVLDRIQNYLNNVKVVKEKSGVR